MVKFIDGIAMSAEYARRNNLKKLFDSQIETLKERNAPNEIVREFQSQKEQVIGKASSMVIGKGNIPFVPIIKPICLGYYGLMSMVKIGLKSGHASINPFLIEDRVETPDGFYYIYDVEDGKSARKKTAEGENEFLKFLSRSPLVAAEVINLCIITDVLSRHYMDAIGSQFCNLHNAPAVYRDDFGFPEFGWIYAYLPDDRFRSPSCGSRG